MEKNWIYTYTYQILTYISEIRIYIKESDIYIYIRIICGIPVVVQLLVMSNCLQLHGPTPDSHVLHYL